MERHQIRRYIGRGIGIAIGLVVAANGPGVNATPAVAPGRAVNHTIRSVPTADSRAVAPPTARPR